MISQISPTPQQLKMKVALLLAFVGLQTVSAVTPFEAIVEEWEVGKGFSFLVIISSFVTPRPGNSNTRKLTPDTMETRLVEATARRKASG